MNETKSIDWAFRLFHPDLRPKAKEWRGQPFAYVDLKLDGHRLTIYRGEVGQRLAIGRMIQRDLWDKLSKNKDLCDRIDRTPPGTVIDGELCGHDTSSDVVTALNDGTATFCAFGLPIYGGRDMRAGNHESNRRILELLGFTVPGYIDVESVANLESAWNATYINLIRERLHDYAKANRAEGVVLKLGHYSGWYKVKAIKTCDLIVTDWHEGEGKHSGRMGALTVGYRWCLDTIDGIKPVCQVGTGFSDPERDLTCEHWLGRVVEVAYDRIAADGGLRFPRFVRMRPDKTPEECRGQEIFENNPE